MGNATNNASWDGPRPAIARRAARWVAFVLVAAATVATNARADELVDAAKAAINAKQFCEARDLYVALHRRDKESKYLYNAAESAAAANDRQSALSLFQQLLNTDPGFARADKAKERVSELGQLIAASGLGEQCPARAPRCGDTFLDAREMCDDGNTVDGDGCDKNCTPTSCGNGIVTPPETCDDGNVADGDGCDSSCGVATSTAPVSTTPDRPVVTPQEKPFPVAAAVVTGAGGALVLGGAIIGAVGGAGWLGLQGDKEAFTKASAAATQSPDDQQKLGDVIDTRTKADASINDWNNLGQWLWIAGVTTAGVGAGVAVAGAAWWAVGE